MKRRALMVLVASFFAGATAAAPGEPASAERWLERMSRAVHELDYRGTFVYRQGNRLQTMAIYHAVRDGRERERLVALNGTPSEVVRDGEVVTCYLPEDKPITATVGQFATRPFRFGELPGAQTLETAYRLELQGRDRVADEPVQKIAVIPRDRFRYGQNIWVAVDSGMPLRTELVGSGGEAVEQLMFTQFELFHSLPAALLRPGHGQKGAIQQQLAPADRGLPGQPNWVLRAPPTGFGLASYQRGHQKSMEHLVYSDGLASVSVFVEPAAGAEAPHTGLSRRGALHTYGLSRDGHRITVVGEVPAETVELIAKGIERREPERD